MSSGAIGSKMSIVDSREHRDSGGRSHVLVAVFIDHVLNAIWLMIAIVTKNRVMHRPSSALKSDVRVEIKVPLKRRCDVALNQTAWRRITFWIAGAGARETADMVAFGGDDNRNFAIPRARVAETRENCLDMDNFLFKYVYLATPRRS